MTLFSFLVAERTGLEPATPGVTGRYSNQLNYRSPGKWWVLRGSNPRPTPCKGVALPAELSTLCAKAILAKSILTKAKSAKAKSEIVTQHNPATGYHQRQGAAFRLIETPAKQASR
jgi:hypothetical protein